MASWKSLSLPLMISQDVSLRELSRPRGPKDREGPTSDAQRHPPRARRTVYILHPPSTGSMGEADPLPLKTSEVCSVEQEGVSGVSEGSPRGGACAERAQIPPFPCSCLHCPHSLIPPHSAHMGDTQGSWGPQPQGQVLYNSALCWGL